MKNLHYDGDIKEQYEYKLMKDELNGIVNGLFDNMDKWNEVPYQKQFNFFEPLLADTCTTTNDIIFSLARFKIWQIPEEWIVENIDEVLKKTKTINLDDSFEYANLLAAFHHMPSVLEKIIELGLNSGNKDVVEFANKSKKLLPKGSKDIYNMTMDIIDYYNIF